MPCTCFDIGELVALLVIIEYRDRRSLKVAVWGVGILVEVHRFVVGFFHHVEL